MTAAICYFEHDVPDAFIASFRNLMPQRCEAAAATLIAALVTEKSANNYPPHPIREGEHVFVWFLHHRDAAAARPIPLPAELANQLCRPVEILRLRPTARSRRMDLLRAGD